MVTVPTDPVPAPNLTDAPADRQRVSCDDGCGAYDDPITYDETCATLDHFRSHSVLGDVLMAPDSAVPLSSVQKPDAEFLAYRLQRDHDEMHPLGCYPSAFCPHCETDIKAGLIPNPWPGVPLDRSPLAPPA